MNTRFGKVLMAAAVVGMSAASAMAAPSYLDGSSKARGDFGSTRGTVRTPMYRSSTPVVVQRQAPRESIAQTPTERRGFSYEPAQPRKDSAGVDRSRPAPQGGTAQRSTRTYRSFSYEPTYESRAMGRGRSGSRTPAYALPRTDSRKLGGG